MDRGNPVYEAIAIAMAQYASALRECRKPRKGYTTVKVK